MHYAGYSADLGRLGRLAAVNGLALVEDAAHAPAVASGSGQPGTGMLGDDRGCRLLQLPPGEEYDDRRGRNDRLR